MNLTKIETGGEEHGITITIRGDKPMGTRAQGIASTFVKPANRIVLASFLQFDQFMVFAREMVTIYLVS